MLKVWTLASLFSQENPLIIFIGRNGSGKTQLLKRASVKFHERIQPIYPSAENKLKTFNSLLTSEKKKALIFEDIDQGLDLENQEKIACQIVSSKKTIICSTHNPFFMNQFSDEVAERSFIYCVNKNWIEDSSIKLLSEDSETLLVSFFSIPSQKQKLIFMNAGEVFADTYLKGLEQGEIMTLIGSGNFGLGG